MSPRSVEAAITPGLDAAAAQLARRAVMNTIEQESLSSTGLRSDVVTLYHGGEYHLYRYKKYTDVRLVFAPEIGIAFFGGDPDNFEYPRYDLDICFFRVYEHGEPAKIKHFLKWSVEGPKQDELVFVAGNPGHTDRLNTVDHLEFLRDTAFPSTLNRLRREEVLLKTFADRSKECARRAQDELFGVQNSRKARLGGLDGLQDPRLMATKRAAERTLREQVARDPKLAFAKGAWDDVATSIHAWGEVYVDNVYLEQGAAFRSQLYAIAHALVRMAEETPKPNSERLREFRESNRESLEQSLFSTAPIYDDLEILTLGDSLAMFMERFGANHPLVVKVLDGKSPRERAAELVHGTRLADVAVRKQLAAGGETAIASSSDAMIELARLVDGPARQVRKQYEQRVDEPLRQAYNKIARAKFLIGGRNEYPDATFTLRLAFGTVRGYEQGGRRIPAWTTIGGAFEHAAEHDNQPPFQLPARWLERRDQLDMATPLNFVSTADIIGGNSGSPVVNRANEFVGIIFDGNIESLVLDFMYTDKQARATSVHSAAILEALRKVYDAQKLVDELTAP